MSAALTTRKKLGFAPKASVCVLDAAERLGIDVRLVDLQSMEGMYVQSGAPRIFISTKRPMGRRNFTCAHELGHHVLGHGEQFDELVKEKTTSRRDSPTEFQADCFAGFFLMPKTAVESACALRDIVIAQLSAAQVLTLSTWFGVGYSTFVTHLRYGLSRITHEHMQRLLRGQPSAVRAQILGRNTSTPLAIADEYWFDRTIDMEVGGQLLLPRGATAEGPLSTESHSTDGRPVFVADSPGLARVEHGPLAWSAFVRISKRDYEGCARYRYEPEADE